MEFIIGVGIGVAIGLLSGKKKRHDRKQSNSANLKTDRQKLRQADEELITAILPTIHTGK